MRNPSHHEKTKHFAKKQRKREEERQIEEKRERHGATSRKINIPWEGGCTGCLALGDASVLDGVQRSEKTTDGDGAGSSEWKTGRNFVFQTDSLALAAGNGDGEGQRRRKGIRRISRTKFLHEETRLCRDCLDRHDIFESIGSVRFNWA